MTENQKAEISSEEVLPFFDQPEVQLVHIPVGPGVPLGIKQMTNADIRIGGAYGTWGEDYDNTNLTELVEQRLGRSIGEEDKMDLASLGFIHRHHLQHMTPQENIELEIAIGARLLREAAFACGWEPEEVDGVLIGTTAPIVEDYTVRIAREAGVPERALKVSVHKACDGSVGALHMALNPNLDIHTRSGASLAQKLEGKKVLVGGIEGLSRFIEASHDKYALQLFGNAGGVIGVIPGETMEYLVGKTYEVYDDEGVLAVQMYYPHSPHRQADESNVEILQVGENHIRVAGLMNEPESGLSVAMAGPMGMVKLFVRTGVQVVKDVYGGYRTLMEKMGSIDKNIAVAIVHHANLKINKLKEKHLQTAGIQLDMPWLLSEFGNVSAASNMIAFLKQLPRLKTGDHVLFDGFGAGTYYDVLVVSLGR
jgi:3-oxoacyl-[acyl-carrier-protein] synthase III